MKFKISINVIINYTIRTVPDKNSGFTCAQANTKIAMKAANNKNVFIVNFKTDVFSFES